MYQSQATAESGAKQIRRQKIKEQGARQSKQSNAIGLADMRGVKDSTTRYVAKDQNIISGVQGTLPALAPAFNRQAVTPEDRVQRRSIAFVIFLTTSHDRPRRNTMQRRKARTQSTETRGSDCLKSKEAEICG